MKTKVKNKDIKKMEAFQDFLWKLEGKYKVTITQQLQDELNVLIVSIKENA